MERKGGNLRGGGAMSPGVVLDGLAMDWGGYGEDWCRGGEEGARAAGKGGDRCTGQNCRRRLSASASTSSGVSLCTKNRTVSTGR